jgi:hypothetical protein
MKKLEIKDEEYFGIETFEHHEKRVLIFLKKIDLEKVSLFDIKTMSPFTKNGTEFTTIFYFKTEKNGFIKFNYEKNKKVTLVKVWDDLTLDGVIEDENKYDLIDSFWQQFVKHFNLRIRLMFINETTEWKWNM